jgi:hypothetical protein
MFEKSAKDALERTCVDAKIFILNEFPVAVSVETSIDIILIIAIAPETGNYYSPKQNNGRSIYLHNQIIPIKFINGLKESNIEADGNNTLISGLNTVDFSSEINSMKFGLLNYLTIKCDFIRSSLFIEPIIFIENKSDLIFDHYLLSNEFSFATLNRYFAKCSFTILSSYNEWRSDLGYSMINQNIERITDQASKDSVLGYLTKNKIDRIAKELSSAKAIFEELNNHLVIINGKAGSGKSTELLLLTIKCIKDGENSLYLTYNKLLIFDITRTIRSYRNLHLNRKSEQGEVAVKTLHSFFHKLSLGLGVLHVLNEDRISLLLNNLRIRMRTVYDFLKPYWIENDLNFDTLKTAVQNHQEIDKATKEVGIDFINFVKRESYKQVRDIQKISVSFFNHKKQLLENIAADNIFLTDYYGVLENTLLAIQDTDKYSDKFSIQDKFDLLESVLDLKADRHDQTKNGTKININEFKTRIKRSVGGHRRGRFLFVDEAQDCHRLEKDILVKIFGSNRLVIANGGKEQLIRHVDLCNWEVSQGKKLNVKTHHKRNKSYRVKRSIAEFCNYVAKKFEIDLNLEPLDSADEGEVLFDFRPEQTEKEINDLVTLLSSKGEVHGCSQYESLLILLEPSKLGGSDSIQEGIVNEFGNIEESLKFVRREWKFIRYLEQHGFMFWDGTVVDKTQLLVPSPNEVRVIFYESCRGLEAWTVSCFNLDVFFNEKMKEPEAEKYLIDDLLLSVDNEKRKKMYAATWILMAMTRAIDTLYVGISNRSSLLGEIALEYISLGKKNVRQI